MMVSSPTIASTTSDRQSLHIRNDLQAKPSLRHEMFREIHPHPVESAFIRFKSAMRKLTLYQTSQKSRTRQTVLTSACQVLPFHIQSISINVSDTLGRRTVKIVPSPKIDSTSIFPSCARTISLQIERPRPVPPIFRLSELSTR